MRALAQRAPDALGRGRHRDIADAERARASRMAFITVGVPATVPPSPTPLAPSGLVGLGTGLKSIAKGGKMSARGIA
jgi:hypothetical protein